MQLNIEHRTRYTYDTPADYSIQQLHLTPQSGFGQRVRNWQVRVNGGSIKPHADPYGNTAHTLVLDTPHREIRITAFGEVETGLDIPPPADTLPLQVYLRTTPLTKTDAALADFARRFSAAGKMNKSALHALMHGIRDRIAAQSPAATHPVGAIAAFAAGIGDCRDHAHAFIACCRRLGVPARYVSGYLVNPQDNLADNHAWADAWLDGKWLSFDITNLQPANGIHVRLAIGLDARDASPINMVRHHHEDTLSHSLKARKLEQSQQ